MTFEATKCYLCHPLYHNHLTRQAHKFDGLISVSVFPSSKINPKTSLSKFPMFWRRHSIKKATILSVKVLAVIRFSSYRKDKCGLRYGKLIRKRRNSFECLGKVISLAKRRYTGTYNFEWVTANRNNKQIFLRNRDDLRTANIVADSPEGVTCLVIDRDTFNQLISNLDDIRTRYDDEGMLERKRWVLFDFCCLHDTLEF